MRSGIILMHLILLPLLGVCQYGLTEEQAKEILIVIAQNDSCKKLAHSQSRSIVHLHNEVIAKDSALTESLESLLHLEQAFTTCTKKGTVLQSKLAKEKKKNKHLKRNMYIGMGTALILGIWL